jgi:hypothetical protein
VTVDTGYSDTGMYIPHMNIFRGASFLESYTQDLPAGLNGANN